MNTDNTQIYLCKADCSLLGTITGIKPETCSLKRNSTDLWELTFEIDRYIESDGQLVQSDYYDSIDEMMRLYLDSDNVQAFFMIDSEPVISGDSYQEIKKVTAHSIECELCNMFLQNLKINCGTYDSQEYLACDTDNNGNINYYNVDPYTGLPYEYISLVNYDDPQLSLLHLVLQGTNWSVKEGLDSNIYLDKDNYFKTVINTVNDPSGNSSECIRGYVKKKCDKSKKVYAIELHKWASSGIEFTTENISNVTVTAQSTNTINAALAGKNKTISIPSPIALVDSNNKFYNNEEGLKTVEWKSEDENGITLTYKNLKPGTYKIISPYDLTDNNYGVQIKSIIVSEHATSSALIQHTFNSLDLSSDADNEKISGICQIKKSFETSDSIYSFLMKTVSPAASVIFEFDRKNRQIGVVKASDYGKDTGIFITMRNLMNSFEVTSSSNDAIKTKIVPTGANNLGIEQVNFGKDHIINLDYFMNTLNEYGDYKYVSKDLHDKYSIWKNYRDVEKVTYNDFKDEADDNCQYTRRELYAQLTKLYNQAEASINELKNRVPNDGCFIDYTKFSPEELKQSYIAYDKALATLCTCYKNDIIKEYSLPKETIITINDDFSLTFTPELEKSISPARLPDTAYWYDYYAYKEKIIPQIIESFKMYYKTDENGNFATNPDGTYIELEYGNQKYYTDASIVSNIDSYLYEWSLYGLDELESKKKAWGECVNLLFNECFILSDSTEEPIYRTPDDSPETGWNSLNQEQKAEFTTKDAFFNQLNQFLDYMSFDNERKNSLTGLNGKGIIRQCKDAIEKRKTEINKKKAIQKKYDDLRTDIANSVTLENFMGKNSNIPIFTKKDLNIIQSMLRTDTYDNENILSTSLDDTVSIVNRQEELYQSASEKLYEISQPQYSFTTELDNLYALNEFKAYQKPFDVGNFIRVGREIHEELYDNQFIKLRLISITHNPLKTNSELSVEFSTMTKSLYGIDDIDFLLDRESTSGSGSSSSSSGGSGTYGNNDANVQISNNMLNALLKTETFGTAVSDIILDTIKANKGNFNTLLSNSGIFNSLESGELKVSGDCLFDQIKSKNYEKNVSGSILNLVDGSFSFAGGALSYDQKTGLNISNDEGTTNISGGCLTTGSIQSSNWNGTRKKPLSNTVGSILQLGDGTFNFGGGKFVYDGTDLKIDGKGILTGTFNGVVNGSQGQFSDAVKFGNHSITNNGAEYTGNSATASKLKKPLYVNLLGDVSGSGALDGSEDVNINVKILKEETVQPIANFTCDGYDEGQIAYSFNTSDYDSNSSNDRVKFLLYMVGSSSSDKAFGTDDRIALYLITRIIYGTNVANKLYKLKLISIGSYGSSTRWSFPVEVDSPKLEIKVSKGSWISGKIWMLK